MSIHLYSSVYLFIVLTHLENKVSSAKSVLLRLRLESRKREKEKEREGGRKRENIVRIGRVSAHLTISFHDFDMLFGCPQDQH